MIGAFSPGVRQLGFGTPRCSQEELENVQKRAAIFVTLSSDARSAMVKMLKTSQNNSGCQQSPCHLLFVCNLTVQSERKRKLTGVI